MAFTGDDQRIRLIAGLRELADFLASRPDVPVPYSTDISVFVRDGSDEARCAEVGKVAAAIGAEISPEHLAHGQCTASIAFGPVAYSVVAVLSDARARYEALMSYADSVTPDSPEEM